MIYFNKIVFDEKNPETNNKPAKAEKFVEGIDYYFADDLMILTAHFLFKRGYCCGNNCRHCPYPKPEKADL